MRLGLDDAHGRSIKIDRVVDKAPANRQLHHRHPKAGRDVDIVGALHRPPGSAQVVVDDAPRRLFGALWLYGRSDDRKAMQ